MYQALRLPKINITISQKYLAMMGITAVGIILCGVAVITAVNLSQTSNRLDTLSQDTALGDAYGRMLTSVAEASGYAQQFTATGDPQQAALTLQAIQAQGSRRTPRSRPWARTKTGH